jgi:hypothetical protein
MWKCLEITFYHVCRHWQGFNLSLSNPIDIFGVQPYKKRMKPTLTLLAFSCSLLLVQVNGHAQTKIEQSKSEVRTGGTSSSSSQGNSSSSSSRSSNKRESCGILGDAFLEAGKLFFGVTYGLLIGNGTHDTQLHNPLSKYPYQNRSIGNYIDEDDSTKGKAGFRFDISNQYLFSNKDLQGNHFTAKIRPFQYFFLQGDYVRLFEYNHATKKNDQLTLVNANFCYDRVRLNRFNLGWTLGMTYIGNEVRRAGVNLGLSTDIFIAKPISIAASAKWATVNKQPVNQLSLKANYHVKQWQVSLGYERFKIATPEFRFFSAGVGVSL